MIHLTPPRVVVEDNPQMHYLWGLRLIDENSRASLGMSVIAETEQEARSLAAAAAGAEGRKIWMSPSVSYCFAFAKEGPHPKSCTLIGGEVVTFDGTSRVVARHPPPGEGKIILPGSHHD